MFFKHYPLSFHKDAHLAHQASIEAQAQGKFWEYHDLLFANNRKLKRKNLEEYARKVGLDMTRFGAALDTGRHKARVAAEILEGGGAGVQGTPTVFINGKKASGLSFAKLKAQVDPILLKKGYKLKDLPTGIRHEIKVGNSPMKGPRKAPVTIYEFSDFQCPFCSVAGLKVPSILKMYPKLVNVVFKHFPLSFHKDAPLAHQASLAAQEQGQFWKYHDLLFKNQRSLKRPALERYAQQLKLNMTRFKQALDSGIFKEQVGASIKQGGAVGVSGTPTFFVNGLPVKSPGVKDIVTVIEKELKRLKIKSPVSKDKLKKLGVDLSAKKPKVRPVVRVAPRRAAPPARRAGAQKCLSGKSTKCVAPKKR